MRYLFGFMCVLALALVGCSETTGDGRGGGAGGSGGSGGGGIDNGCEAAAQRCTDGTTEPIAACCELEPPPEQADACAGTESLWSPSECAKTGNTVTYKLTFLKLADSCNAGYDVDWCDGVTCFPSGPSLPSEGLHGVDNALSGLAPTLESFGGNLSGVDQALSDGLCGLTDDCSREIAAIEIRFEIDRNEAERCANVRVIGGETSSDAMLHVGDRVSGSGSCAGGAGSVGGNGGVGGSDRSCTSDAECEGTTTCEGVVACASGKLGTIPLKIGAQQGALENALVRMTISTNGFSHGLLGGTLDKDAAIALIEGNAGEADAATVVGEALDIMADLRLDTSRPCNALSATLGIGGVAD